MEYKDWKIDNVSFPNVSEKVKQMQISGYRQECLLLSMIRNGQVEELSDYMKDVPDSMLNSMLHNGDFTDSMDGYKSALRNEIVLASRTVIAGGAEPGEAFYILNVYQGLLSKTTEHVKMHNICKACFCAFAVAVQVNSRQSSAIEQEDYLTRRVHKYIRQHICDPIAVKDIADALGLNYSYLSHSYRTTNQISLVKKIQMMKCETAKKLLVTTEMSLNELSHYMGFSSQSHFNNVFKQICGLTPGEYRKQLQ